MFNVNNSDPQLNLSILHCNILLSLPILEYLREKKLYKFYAIGNFDFTHLHKNILLLRVRLGLFSLSFLVLIISLKKKDIFIWLSKIDFMRKSLKSSLSNLYYTLNLLF